MELGSCIPFAGAIFAVAGTCFQMFSDVKENDQNITDMKLFIDNVTEWMQAITPCVGASEMETVPKAFKGMNEAFDELVLTMQQWVDRTGIVKALGGAEYKQKFESLKEKVKELKSCVADAIGAETAKKQAELEKASSERLDEIQAELDNLKDVQKVQEEMDGRISQLELLPAVVETLADNMEVLMAKMAHLEAASKKSARPPPPREETLWYLMQNALEFEGAQCKWTELKMGFEYIFDCRLPFEQARGLRFAMDIERTGQIKKIEWFQWYQTWQKTGKNVEDYCLELATKVPPGKFAR